MTLAQANIRNPNINALSIQLKPTSFPNSDSELVAQTHAFPASPLLSDSHPSDLKHRFHRHHSASSLHGSFNHNHVQDSNLPLVAEEHDEHHESKGPPVYDPKQDVFVSLFVCLLRTENPIH